MDGRHAGIMICHQKRIPFLETTDERMYACGVDILIEHFLKHGIPFNVYDCYTPEDGSRVIRNPDVSSLWIFGHGMKSGIYFGYKETLHYAEMHDAPKKEFIGQFHCNALGGRSLADYIGTEGCSFVEEGYRCTHQNRKAIRRLLRDPRLRYAKGCGLPTPPAESACAR
ncbi:MAG: hypothetical protein QMD46_01960 [Methanomicrobiales archaeon]|nr:hypothetical protein [Methanomicrobiales archaeon]MDI6875206.1 hypothetical protein [Methanomicrobiales archaeon]